MSTRRAASSPRRFRAARASPGPPAPKSCGWRCPRAAIPWRCSSRRSSAASPSRRARCSRPRSATATACASAWDTRGPSARRKRCRNSGASRASLPERRSRPSYTLPMQLVDIGANLTHGSFRDDVADVIARARAAGVGQIIVTGTTIEDSRAALALGLPSTAGVHPHHARECGPDTIPALAEIAGDKGVVAIGECGLDFNRNYSPHPDQEKWFVAQAELALSLQKPLFLHSRDAHPRFSQIIASLKIEKAVAHCFTGEKDELHAYLDLGLYIGITGWICDERRGRHLLQL